MMKKSPDADVREEMLGHVERLTADNIAAGMTPTEARRMALLKFGSVEALQEATRADRRWAWLADFGRDVRHSLRLLRKSPTFTTVVIATLALGIGANGAIFSLINAVLLRPLPVAAPERLVMFSDVGQGTYGGPLRPGPLQLFSYPLFERLRAQSPAFEDLAAQQAGDTASQVIAPDGDDHGAGDLAFGRAVSANFFDLLGVRSSLGRVLRREDQTAPGADAVVVLSHRYWRQRFAGAAEIIGSRLQINGTSYTVIGVAAPGFVGTNAERVTDFWVPATMHDRLWRDHRSWLPLPQGAWLLVMGRLRPGVTLAAAQASANVVFRRFLAENPTLVGPGGAARTSIILHPGQRGVSELRRFLGPPLLALSAGATLLLLIVCFNLSHLLLARTMGRQRELGIRAALGAGRARLVRQLLTESLLLCLAGAALAIPLAHALSLALLSLNFTDGTSLSLHVSTDLRTLAFTTALAVITAALLGLVPAWYAARGDLHGALRATSPQLTGRPGRQRWLNRALLASQVALSFVLILGAAMLSDSLRRLRLVDKGFDERNGLLVQLNTPMTGLKADQRGPLYDQLLARIAALPGVESASLSQNKLLEGRSQTRISPRGTTSVYESVEVDCNIVTPGYFDTLGMTLRRGRDFNRGDDKTALRVAIVNETLARRQFGSEDAVGLRFIVPREPAQEYVVIGVVHDVRVGGLRLDPPPMVYFTVAQERDPLGSLEIRTQGDPTPLVPEIRRAVHEVQSSWPIMSVRTLRQQVERSLTTERMLATTANSFGLGAVLLVCVGLFGLMSQWAAQRTSEIGVRIALGATRRQVRTSVMREALVLVLAGLGIGIPAALITTTWVRSLLFGASALHPALWAGSAVGLLLVAAAAAYLPAHRASRIDPMVALRHE
jgi:predicted permease